MNKYEVKKETYGRVFLRLLCFDKKRTKNTFATVKNYIKE
jgi:hypothetical protein